MIAPPRKFRHPVEPRSGEWRSSRTIRRLAGAAVGACGLPPVGDVISPLVRGRSTVRSCLAVPSFLWQYHLSIGLASIHFSTNIFQIFPSAAHHAAWLMCDQRSVNAFTIKSEPV